MAREGTARFAKCFGLVITVSVEQTKSGAGEIHGVLEFAARGVVIVVALCVHHSKCWIESARTRTIEAVESVIGTT